MSQDVHIFSFLKYHHIVRQAVSIHLDSYKLNMRILTVLFHYQHLFSLQTLWWVFVHLYSLINVYLFIWLCRSWLWHVGSRTGIEPRPPALRAQSLNIWTTREVPICVLKNYFPVAFMSIEKEVDFGIVYLCCHIY